MAISPDGSLVAYVSDEGGGPDIWLAGVGSNPLRLTDDPAAEGAPAWFPDGAALAFVSERGEKASIWKVPVLGGSQTLLVPDALDPAIDPAGTRIAFVRTGSSGSTRVAVTPLRDPTRVTVLTHDDDGLWNHRAPTWSPDGRFIAYAAQRGLWVVPADGGDSRTLTSDGEVDEEPAWSPDGRYVYFRSAREGTEAIWRVAPNGARPERVTLGTGPEGRPSLSRDGRRLAYTTFQDNADLVLRELATGKETTVSSGREHSFPTFSPDGRRIAFVSNRLGGVFRLVEQPISEGSRAGPARAITDHPSAYPAYSPDGRWLAYYRLGGGQDRHVWIVPSGGGQPVQFTDGPTQELHPAWSPRGSEIAFVSDTGAGTELWVKPVAEGRPAGRARRVASSGVGYEAPAWSPDGTQLAVASQAAGRAAAVWLLRAAGSGRPRLVASLGTRVRVRWDQQRPALFVSAFDEGWVTLRRVPLPGEPGAPSDPLRLGPRDDKVDFDVSRDGRWLVFARGRAPTGDVWVAEINDGGGGGPRPAPSRTP